MDVPSSSGGDGVSNGWTLRVEPTPALERAEGPPVPKHVLLDRLLPAVRRRYSWITSQLLHVIAFRPGYFTEHARSWGYGPLYRRVRVSKGRGRYRRIDIPNRPLHGVQRCLLDLLVSQLTDDLPACVTGCRRGQSIYSNAPRHLGQWFVVTIDLADFFPSIDANQIIPTLLGLGEFRLPDMEGDARAATATATRDQDLAVFVARLVTRRGRLPQGAPTSPAIANLVFGRYDRRLLDSLGPEIVYTRYVDDLTFSVSQHPSRRLGFYDLGQFRRFVWQRLVAALDRSPFRINERKVRASTRSERHEITGLRVGADTINLARRARRRVRLLTLKLNRHKLDEVARSPFVGAEVYAQTRLRSQDGGHQRLARRTSTERLARLMVQHFLPDLRAETPASDGSGPVGREPAWLPASLAERWRLIERLLSYLWRGQARAEFATDPHEALIYDGQGRAVCRLTSEKRLDFFLLTPREAIGCTELWHHARGLAAALDVPGNAPCFGRMREQHRRLQGALDAVEFSRVTDRWEPPPPSGASAGGPIDLTRKQQVHSAALRVRDLLNEFRADVVTAEPSPERASHIDTLLREFRYETLVRLLEARSALAAPSAVATSRQRWEELFAWSQRIIGVTTEHLEPRLADDGRPLAEKKLVRQFKDQLGAHVKSLDTIYALRNRQAHEYKPEYWKDWQALQSDVASRLGKRFERNDGKAAPALFTSTTLDLTPEEATQARLALLSDFTDGLSELERRKTGSA
jgi:hypothetical protein